MFCLFFIDWPPSIVRTLHNDLIITIRRRSVEIRALARSRFPVADVAGMTRRRQRREVARRVVLQSECVRLPQVNGQKRKTGDGRWCSRVVALSFFYCDDRLLICRRQRINWRRDDNWRQRFLLLVCRWRRWRRRGDVIFYDLVIISEFVDFSAIFLNIRRRHGRFSPDGSGRNGTGCHFFRPRYQAVGL